MTLRRLLGIATLPLVGALTLLAVSPWLRAYPTTTVGPLLIGATLLSVACPPLVVAVTGRSLGWSALTSAVLFLAYGLVFVLLDPIGVVPLADGVTRGIARILSITLPASDPRWLLIPAVLICWLCGAVCSELTIRTRTTAAVPLVALATFAISFALVSGAPGTSTLAAALVTVAAAADLFSARWVSDQRDTPEPEHGGADSSMWVRPLVLGAASTLVIVAVTTAVVPHLPAMSGPPTTLSRVPPVVQLHPINPVVAVASQRGLAANDDQLPLFTVTTDGPTSGYISVAGLDSYDGNQWRLQTTFQPTGGRIAPPAGSGDSSDAGRLVTQRYRILQDLHFPWIPYIDQPVSVSGLQAEYDPTSGMVVPTSPATAGTSYAVTSAVSSQTLRTLTAEQLKTLDFGEPTNGDDAQPFQAGLVALKNVLLSIGQQTQTTQASTLAYLRVIVDNFTSHYNRIPNSDYLATSGSTTSTDGSDLYGVSLADLQGQVFGAKHAATPEQFATLVTLLARQLGIPARLATGFRLSGPNADPSTVPAGTYTVTNQDSWTWSEVYVPSLGWIVVDPTPAKTGSNPPPLTAGGSATTTTTLASDAQVVTGTSGHAVAAPVRPSNDHLGRLLRWAALVVTSVVLVIALALGVIALLKRRRRHRRRAAPDPRGRIEGAWLEALDSLYEAEVRGLEPLTNSEVVDTVVDRFGTEAERPTSSVATLASVAVFSPNDSLNNEQSSAAWMDVEDVKKVIRKQQRLGDRLWTAVRLAPRRNDRPDA